ncbi:MAG: ABC transporter substrate-binding protein [Rhodobacteraceae bacterium]|nr:ABC transporter substrate-binding protein [Paracoccaceae bacterium]
MPAKTQALPAPNWRVTATAALFMLGGVLAATQAKAQDEATTISHGYSTFGELALPADFAHLPYINPDAPKGGEISISTRGTFDHLNPYATQDGVPGAMANIQYERLFSSTADEVGASYCYLCISVEYPEDVTWAIFHLRHDLTFSDGSPATAHDAVFTHYKFIDQGTPSWSAAVGEMIPLVEALDDYTIKFTFGEGFSANDTIGQAGATLMMSQAWWESHPDERMDKASFEVSPGTGPYMIESYDINAQIIVGRNPNFWGADHPLNIGHNNFDNIRIEYFADTTAAFEAFKAGEFTFRQENSSLNWATAYDFPALENEWVIRDELPKGSLPAATGFVFNLTNERFQDLRVRQAVALMFNFTWTNESLQYGLFDQRESFWQNADMAAQGVAEGLELELLQSVAELLDDPTIITGEVTMPHVSGSNQLDRGNMRSALALLAEAGWNVDDAGVLRNEAGTQFVIEFMAVRPSFERVVTPFVDNLKRLGMDASFNLIDNAQYTERYRNFDFDIRFAYWVNGLEEGESLGQKYGSSGVGDVFNPAHYTNPAVDALIPRVSEATTREEMAAAVRAIDRIMRHDLFIIPTWYLANYWTAYYDMYEHPAELPPYDLGYLSFWWYNAEAGEALVAAGALR